MLIARHRCNSVAQSDRIEGAELVSALGNIGGLQKFAWMAAGVAVAFSLLFPTTAYFASPWVFFAALVILGMPHGVIDALILVSPKYASAVFGEGKQAKFLGGYVGLCAAYAAVWYFWPAVGMGSFLLLTAWHWGSAEFGQLKSKRVLWGSLGATRGLLVVSALFAFHNVDSNTAAGHHGVFISESIGRWIFAVALILHVGIFSFASRGAESRIKYLTEIAIIVALLAIAPVYMAVGIFYMCFHALRFYEWFPKQARLNLAARSELKVATHLVCIVLALLLLAIYLLVGVDSNISTWAIHSVPVHLQLLAVLTLPHTLLCYYFQRGDNQWVSPRSCVELGNDESPQKEGRR